MKKIFSSLLLSCILVSQFQIFPVYADIQSQLELQKEKSLGELEKVEISIGSTIEKLETKIDDAATLEKIQEKQEEITEYLSQVQEKIEGEDSRSEVKALVQEAKKVVVLKVVSGVTEYEDVTQNISKDIASTPLQQEQAQEVLQNTLETRSGDIRLMLRTKDSQEKLKSLLITFDPDIQVDFLYQMDQENYFELTLSEESLFAQEMLPDIKQGKIPESFISLEILSPELFSISQLDLSGENISQTWGVEQYKTYQYFENIPKDRQKIRVAVIDTGVDFSHPDLQGQVSTGYDFVNEDSNASDDQGHGTHVAGTIAANINAQGIIGVNPYVEIIPLKICTSNGFCPSYALMQALEYAKTQRIDVLNMSLGGRGVVADNPICAGIQSVTDAGAIVVAAAGNSNVDTSTFVPGGCPAALSVAAVDTAGKRAVFSNYGSKVDVAAPGVAVSSVKMGGGYKELSGTSMAAPHITGLVSLIQSFHPNVSIAEIKQLFAQFSRPVQSDSGKSIASAVDVPRLLESFRQEKQNIVMPVVENSIISTSQTQESSSGAQTDISSLSADFFKNMSESVFSENMLDFRDKLPFFKDIQTNATQERIVEELPEILGGLSDAIFLNNNWSEQKIEIHSDEVFTPVKNISNEEIIFPGEQKKKIEMKEIFFEQGFGEDASGTEILQLQEDGIAVIPQKEAAKTQIQDVSLYTPDIAGNASQNIYEKIFIEEEKKNDNQKEKEVLLAPEITKTDTPSPEKPDIPDMSQALVLVPEEPKQEILDIKGAPELAERVEISSEDSQPKQLEEIIETPEQVYDTNELGTTEISQEVDMSQLTPLEAETQENTLESGDENMGIQNVSYYTIPVANAFTMFTLSNVDEYTFTASSPDMLYMIWQYYSQTRTGYLHIRTIIPGEIILYGRYAGVLKQVIFITVPPVVKDITLYEGESYSIPVNFNGASYNISHPAVLSATLGGSYYIVKGLTGGTSSFSLRDPQGRERILYNFTVRPKQIFDLTVDEGKTITLPFANANAYSYSFSKYGYITTSVDANAVYIKGQAAGDTTVYIKYGVVVIAELRVTIKKRPTSTYTCTTQYERYCSLSVPYLSEYTLGTSVNGVVDAYRSGETLILYGRSVGTTQVYLYKNGEIYSTISVTVQAGETIPVYTCVVKQGHSCTINIPNTPTYSYTSTSSNNTALVYFSPGSARIEGLYAGNTQMEIKKHDALGYERRTLARVDVQVLPQPPMIQANCSVFVGNSCTFTFPSNSEYSYQSSNSHIGVSKTDTNFTITGLSPGSGAMYIKSGNYTLYYVSYTITQPPATLYGNCIKFETQGCSFSLSNAGQYSYEVIQGGIIETSTYGNSFDVHAKNAGNVTLYVRKDTVVVYVVQVEVKDAPEVIYKTLEVFETKDTGFEINSAIRYDMTLEGEGNIGTYWYNKNSSTGGYGYVKITGYAPGTYTIYLRDTREHLLHYVVTIKVIDIVLNQSALCEIDQFESCYIDFPDLTLYNYRPEFEKQALDPTDAIALFQEEENRLVITGFKPGEDNLRVTLGTIKSYNIHVNVNENAAKFPAVQKISCEVLEGDDCRFILSNARIFAYSNAAGAIAVGSNSFKMYGDIPGVHKAYVLQGRAAIYEIEMTVIDKPESDPLFDIELISGQCNIAVNDTCTVHINAANQYTYKSFFSGNARLSVDSEYLYITGLRTGINYITAYVDTIPVLKVSVYVSNASPNLQLSSYKVQLEKGATTQVQVNYNKYPYTLENVHRSITTGVKGENNTIQIQAHNLGTGYIKVEDEYYTTKTIYVQVVEKPLLLSTSSLEIPLGLSANFKIMESNASTQSYSITKENQNISVYKESYDTYRVRASALGTTRLYISDGEKGGYITVKVVSNTVPPKPVGIRYIRDWINGSDKNTTNHWVEIQAFTSTGANLAQGKTISGSQIANTKRPYTVITDGVTTSSVYGQTIKTGKSFVQVDLGNIYDVEKVKIWHYYKDGRSYKESRTEVSADGETWTTLFDSATQGVYAEPTDGSGRSYEVKKGTLAPKFPTIRYIRDTINGSDKDKNNHWVEIQAMNPYGLNLAQGKTISGSQNAHAKRPYTTIIDGVLTSTRYGQTVSTGKGSVQVDLGQLYEIEKVKIWHYYSDGRKYKESKTEVSADGVTWTTLFDSAVSGTYVETSEGRSYEVKKPSLSPEEQELEALIQEILSGIGVQNVEEDDIAINSYTLTDVQKSKLSEAVKRMTLGKTQQQIDGFNTALKNLEVKYTNHQIVFAMIQYMKNLLKISVIEYIEDISTGNIGGLHFKISQDILGSISNVGVEFINGNGIKERQELKIQADGEYIVAFSNQSCNGCKNLKPYYLISGNTDTYLISFEDENIAVASSSYEIFRNILTNIWYWKGYDKEYNRATSGVIQKIIQIDRDIKSAPQDVSVDLILQTIASKSIDGINLNLKVSGVPTGINIETFPVAGYLLDKFLNGPRGDIRFNTEHWISQKIKNSRDYTNILSLIPNNYDISILEEGVAKTIVLSDSKFDKDFPVSNLDLYFGIGKYKYELSLLKEQGEIYTIVKFYDDYDFPEEAEYGNGLVNSLNALGYYHQTNLKGEIYYWESFIKAKY